MSVHSPLGVPGGQAWESLLRPASSSATRRGRCALGGLILTGAVLAIAAPGTDALLPQTVRPVPPSLAGAFGGSGLNIHTGGLFLVLMAMFGSYVAAVHYSERMSGRAVLVTIGVLSALALLAPPLLSTDVFSYQAYARMFVSYGTNPYLHGPSAISLDAIYPYIGARWVATPSAYGPLFTWLSLPLATMSVATSVLAFKALAAISSIATMALLWGAARMRGCNPVRAVALFGLNPLVLIYGVGGGHNDLLMVLGLTAAVWALLARRPVTSGVMIALAVAVKLTAGIVLPFALAAERTRRRDVLRGLGLTAAAIVIATVLTFGSGPLHLPATLQHSQSAGGYESVPGFVTVRLGLSGLGHLVGDLLGAVVVALSAWLVRRVWLGRVDWIDAAAWATLALLLSASSLLPWYVAWLMPLVGLSHDRRLWRSAVALTGVVQLVQLLGYLPHQ